jgi:hypothetical protein
MQPRSEGWVEDIEPPFTVNFWCSFGANTIETMDSAGQADGPSLIFETVWTD